MKIEKKTWPEYFQLVLDGKKTYDLRLADFECNEGDILVLKEWDPETEKFTGREIEKEVSYVGKLKDFKFWKKEDLDKYGLQCISLKSKEKISKETFEDEIGMCRKHFQKKGYCAWGKCENCGVPLLLKKLHDGEILENCEIVSKFKNDFLQK